MESLADLRPIRIVSALSRVREEIFHSRVELYMSSNALCYGTSVATKEHFYGSGSYKSGGGFACWFGKQK